jgi:hypothetical protein
MQQAAVRKYYFVSDLHMGGDGQLQHCDYTAEFIAFLKQLEKEGPDTELLIVGDTFGFWELTLVQGVEKLDHIIAAHQAIFDQLRATGTRIKITMMVGNHDYDLACNAAFAAKLQQYNIHLDTSLVLIRTIGDKKITGVSDMRPRVSLVLRSLLPYPNSCQGTSPHQQGWDTKMAMLSFCGIDVSKDRLDVVVLPVGWFFSVSNDTAGCAELVVRLRPLAVSAIGLEPSGGYERGIIRALLAAGLSVRRINPSKLRQFARARGVLAKNDRLDARLIAEYVAIITVRPQADVFLVEPGVHHRLFDIYYNRQCRPWVARQTRGDNRHRRRRGRSPIGSGLLDCSDGQTLTDTVAVPRARSVSQRSTPAFALSRG